jgi:hypothetical protein
MSGLAYDDDYVFLVQYFTQCTIDSNSYVVVVHTTTVLFPTPEKLSPEKSDPTGYIPTGFRMQTGSRDPPPSLTGPVTGLSLVTIGNVRSVSTSRIVC